MASPQETLGCDSGPMGSAADAHDLGRQSSYDLGDHAPECDVVMKGGISSGVVYPRAVCRLATSYRLRSIGGASAGAIAATFAAAAEAGRSSGGFVRLDAVPDQLGQDLATLFQPAAATGPAFDVLGAWIEPGWSKVRKARRTIALIVRHGAGSWAATFAGILAIAVAVGVILGRAPDGPLEWVALVVVALAALLVAAVASVAVAASRVVRRTMHALPANGYGLCDGHARRAANGAPPLTDWMAEQLELLAGLRPGTVPLTFGHLWGQEAADAYRVALTLRRGEEQLPEQLRRELRQQRQVDVRVMTTDLTHRRPYSFPFGTQIFHWCPACFRRYFPEHVIDHMVTCSDDVDDEVTDGHLISKVCPVHRDVRLRYLPLAPDLPLVVGARLSLSFPGLISAVPLYAVDWSVAARDRRIVAVWFSDGGIASNFPMHFFDRAWPRRPTFGINLLPLHPSYPDQLTWRPVEGRSGILPRARPLGSMVGFAQAILDTMQNWADNVQITMPGFRDRVVELRQRPGEGGMNLRMEPATITELADRGADAAALFDTFDLDLHRWIRHRVAMSSLDELLTTMHDGYRGPDGYEQFLRQHAPDAPNYPAGAADGAATARLMAVAAEWADLGHPATKGIVPRPKPSLHPVTRP